MFNDPVALTIHAMMGRIEARGGGDGPGADRSSRFLRRTIGTTIRRIASRTSQNRIVVRRVGSRS